MGSALLDLGASGVMSGTGTMFDRCISGQGGGRTMTGAAGFSGSCPAEGTWMAG
jgi:hypothetical protein